MKTYLQFEGREKHCARERRPNLVDLRKLEKFLSVCVDVQFVNARLYCAFCVWGDDRS